MIVVKLIGGLGNQMFGYAAGRMAATRNGVPLKLDLTHYKEQDFRKFELEAWNIRAGIATEKELNAFRRKDYRLLRNRIINKLAFWRSYGQRPWFAQRGFAYDPEFQKIGRNAYLDGQFQSEKFFPEIADALRQEFTLAAKLDDANIAMERAILGNDNAVAVHVRRTDYVMNKQVGNKEAHACSVDYYDSAMKRVFSKVPNARFFVFSDDPEWCKANLHPPASAEMTYVDINPGSLPALDMHLMRQCRHHIISNSTFSWWAAWLADTRPDHIVIVPKVWIAAEEIDDRDVVPARWTRL